VRGQEDKEENVMHLVKVDNTIVNLDLMTEAAFDPDTGTLSIIYIAANVGGAGETNWRSAKNFEGGAAKNLWDYICLQSTNL
jgi:hypothetical protein